MNNRTNRSEELLDLRWLRKGRGPGFLTAEWLNTEFSETVWEGQFGERAIKIDFNVVIDDGSNLTDKKNELLLGTFKQWICIQTHPDATGGASYAPTVAFQAVSRTLRLIDYFLLRADHFKLGAFGLAAVTRADMRRLISDIASSNDTIQTIYQWREQLTSYLKSAVENFRDEDFEAAIRSNKDIALIDNKADRKLLLTDEELVRARAYLWLSGAYISCSNADYRWSVSSIFLSNKIYKNTLWGKILKTNFEELDLRPVTRYRREYLGVAVRTYSEDFMQEATLRKWVASIRTIGLLDVENASVPHEALSETSNPGLLGSITLGADGRFLSLPHTLPLITLRSSIEFFVEYGQDLIDSYLALVKAASAERINLSSFAARTDIRKYLTAKTLSMGVCVWHLNAHMNFVDANPKRPSSRRASADKFFTRMRNNEGLYELLIVLYGAIQLCIGTLMARRQGELMDLIAGKCLDKTGNDLVFENRKSGFKGMREREARPIPKIAARMIRSLEGLQNELRNMGHLKELTCLFKPPSSKSAGLRSSLTSPVFNIAFDRFCDYFNSPLDKNGRRYYVRQHQLRRFFAMLFFWGRSFGGLDTLCWFLGHSDTEHVYRYITESTPGAVLISAKAQFIGEKIKVGENVDSELCDLLEKRFGTRNFSILDSEELEEYLASLLSTGAVNIEPQFIDTKDGKTFKVLVKISGEEA